MLSLNATGSRLCDGITRREVLRVGGLGALGLGLPELLRGNTSVKLPRSGKARSCIVLFLMGGPPQQSTWDPKPDAPAQIRGDFGPIATKVPGIRYCELMPKLAGHADKICVLRAMSTNDNAHSSSGYYMMTGVPHQPMNAENANPGAPNDWPNMGAVMHRLQKQRSSLSTAVRLPNRIFNTDGSVWPGQDAGFLGRGADPWLFTCQPAAADYRIPELSLPAEISLDRLNGRTSLLHAVNRRLDAVERGGGLQGYDDQHQQAFDLLRSSKSRLAFDLDREPVSVRDRYGRHPFGQSVLLSRRLVEAGVSLVQVNWYRGPEEPSDAPCWDSHVNEGERLKKVLVPPTDQASSALLEDLEQRGLLDETLIVWMAEFGRSPKLNARAGRDHWGHVFSVALAGGGVRGGQVLGASDSVGGYPKDGRVAPQDLTATIFHALGHAPDTEIRDNLNRPIPISRGQVIRQVF
jgi:uncharacterized protein (DUF1501 family)